MQKQHLCENTDFFFTGLTRKEQEEEIESMTRSKFQWQGRVEY